MKLELKHLVPYLPYNLRMMSGYYLVGLSNCDPEKYEEHDSRMMIMSETPRGSWNWEAHANMDKPILYPLSDYKDINSKAMNELNIDLADQIELNDLAWRRQHYSTVIYRVMEICFEKHIDIFGLIDKGLAIDINEL